MVNQFSVQCCLSAPDWKRCARKTVWMQRVLPQGSQAVGTFLTWSLSCLCHPASLVQAESITFTVVHPPRHGLIERSSNGQRYHPTATFTMDDVYQNRISYSHDGSNSLKDRFAFTVSDGTNPFFVVEDGGKKVSGQRGRRERPQN